MNHNKRQFLEASLAYEKMARKETEVTLQETSRALQNKNQELESAKTKIIKLVNEKQIELDNLFRSIIDPYILMDLFGNVIKMNKAAEDFFGLSQKKKSFNVMTTVYEEDIEYTHDAFQEFLETGSFRNFQARLYNSRKELKWVDINCNLIYNSDGKPHLAQGIIRDITEQKKQQEYFNEQKKQLDAIIENSSLGIVLTEDGKILKTNKAFQNFLRYTEEELLELSVADISIKEDKEKSYELMRKLDNGEINSFSIVKKYKAKNDKIFRAKTNVSLVKNNKNKDYQVAVIEDFTKEYKNQSLLKALNHLMSSIMGKTNIKEIAWELAAIPANLLQFENATIYLLDSKTKNIECVAAYRTKKKYSLNFTIADEILKSGKSQIINNVLADERYENDQKTHASEIFIPIIDKGVTIGFISSKNTAKSFFTKKHLKTLETIANLAATQLQSAMNLRLLMETDKTNKTLVRNLKISNKELNDFAQVVSHDLKSPLRSMNALINWIKDENETSPNAIIEEYINLLFKQVDKMDHLINGILKYAKIDQVKSAKRKTSLKVLIPELIDTIYVPEHVTITIPSRLPFIKMDKFRLHQLFQNLIDNAIKYSNKERGIVILDAIERKTCWEFSISDNGPGIPEQYHDKIFKIFQTLGDEHSSTGVGLSIVKKIIDLLGGKIWLRSKEDEGTTIYFTLPK
ncbi:PAS domain S-box-containing protein [Tenacibaculum sp. MAR_2009_124]|uniref:PAS domain-containing sensor histidine kinase n=1 Tax=Tenacibaculum sp. MAR_2009_124 TaxID=1250059 RepID=UPI000895C1A4|nr:PAS domain S-box protein [Tenacibaculum sp. MAR_2009_124]SEB99501.1 PAS domain S-box-containing protein [Tenacibaculum sp. MAR_2009_124]